MFLGHYPSFGSTKQKRVLYCFSTNLPQFKLIDLNLHGLCFLNSLTFTRP